MARFTLDALEGIVAERALASDGTSYTASLAACGIEKCAQKMGEEAVEAVIAAATGDRDALTREAADLLYHLMVVLNVSAVPLRDVMDELDRRSARSGLAEKAARTAPSGPAGGSPAGAG